MTTLRDFEEAVGAGPELIEVEQGDEAELIEVQSGLGLGNSLLQLHQNFISISGGAPHDDMSAMPPFEGGTPGTTFTVPQNYKNSVGG